MNESDLRWLALLFDTEGHFSLNKGSHAKSKRPAKRGFVWGPKASVTNTYKELLEVAQKITNGKGRLSPQGSSSYRLSNKRIYLWTLRRDEIKALLPEIIPYLLEKKERAELLLEAVKLFDVCKGLGLNPITPIRDRRLETIFWRLRFMNAKSREGPKKVLIEEEEAEHIPYSSDEFEKDVKLALEAKEGRRIRKQRVRVRRWRAEHPDVYRESQMKANVKGWSKRKERVKTDPAYREHFLNIHRKTQRNYYAKHRDEVLARKREKDKLLWQETKKRLESDPMFRERYLAGLRERQRRHQERKARGL